MEGRARITDPDDVEFSITLTATIGEWKTLRQQLGTEKHPAWKVTQVINHAVLQAEQTFYGRHDKEDE